MEKAVLKSKALKVYDFRNVDVSEYAVKLPLDEKRYERDLTNLLRRFSTHVNGDSVQKDDMVQISCSSELEKFNKEHLKLRAGLGLFSKELEGQLIGMELNQANTVTVNGSKATVTVESIEREILPELTDELAEKSGLEDVHTAEDLKAFCRWKQYDGYEAFEENADEAFSYTAGQVMENSLFELDEGEKEESYQSLQAYANVEGDPEVIEKQRRTTAETLLKAAVLGEELKDLTEEDFDHQGTFTGFLIDSYSDAYLTAMEKHVHTALKKAGDVKEEE